MIDTLKLFLTDFEITPECPVKVQPASYSLSGETEPETELFRLNGQTVTGAKAFLNTSKFRFDINSKGVFLTTEVSKWYGESNFRPVTEKAFIEFSCIVKNELLETGIKTDLEGAKLSRVDLFRNGDMKHLPNVYLPVLLSCRGRRMHKRYYGDTVLFHNGKRETCFYDKFQQMETNGQDVSDIPRNSLRAEIRLKQAETVQRFTGGMKLFRDLKTNFAELPNVYRYQLHDTVFRYGTETPEQMDCFEDDLKTLNFFKETAGRSAFNKWLFSEGVLELLERYGDIDKIRHLLLQVFSKGAVSKQVRRIEETVKTLRRIGLKQTTFLDLYNELTETFLKVA